MSGPSGDMSAESAPNEYTAFCGESIETLNEAAERLTTEKVFDLAVGLLLEKGYECLSEDKIEDFTERIDGVLKKRGNSNNGESSGYPRILSVYRSGRRIHVELYNFLKSYPSDSLEMKEASESLTNLFDREASVKLDIHE